MVTKYLMIQNNSIMAMLNRDDNVVLINNIEGTAPKMFAGIPGLADRYIEFEESFSDQVNYDDAIRHFTPAIQQTFISQ